MVEYLEDLKLTVISTIDYFDQQIQAIMTFVTLYVYGSSAAFVLILILIIILLIKQHNGNKMLKQLINENKTLHVQLTAKEVKENERTNN